MRGGDIRAGPPNSNLWEAALAMASDWEQRLVDSLADMRLRAEPIAAQIADDLPEFTVHDTTHADALWPLIDLVGGDDLSLTPSEAWALGVAVILHDLGLATAAYPGGLSEVRESAGWADARAAAVREALGRRPTADELAAPNEDIDFRADAAILRQRHAERADELARLPFPNGSLVSDEWLRDNLAATAGRVAASHWWPMDRLRELGRLEGAPAGMPNHWTVRPILLACLLRVADASHLDALRAPRAERQRRKLGKISSRHWDFQGRLRQPVLEGDRLQFTSTDDFGPELAGAWWTCLDHLRLLDNQLIGSAAVLQDHDLPVLAARSVVGARDTRELAAHVRTRGWTPVDASVEISDVAGLIGRLGGRALYGDTPLVPLRELLQNASDAVRVREHLRPGHRGRIEVMLSKDGRSLAVQDTGTGMDLAVLTGVLLDFGHSLWESPRELAASLPGLQATGFSPTGRFGIGFFSVFMWTRDVRVVTRHLTAGEPDTFVLSFAEGLGGRPILSRAAEAERLTEPGTRVELTMPAPLTSRFGDDSSDPGTVSSSEDLVKLLGWLAPCLPVDLWVRLGDDASHLVSIANDWLTLPGSQLLARIGSGAQMAPDKADARVLVLGDPDAEHGRATLIDEGRLYMGATPGVFVAGGLRTSGSSEFAGVLFVDDVDASRTSGTPTATSRIITAWAEEQARVLYSNDSYVEGHARTVLALGADPQELPWCRTRDGVLATDEAREWARSRLSLFVVDAEHEADEAREHQFVPHFPEIELGEDVVDLPRHRLGKRGQLRGVSQRSLEALLRATVAEAWGCDPDEIRTADVDGYDYVSIPIADEIDVSAEHWSRPQPHLPGIE